MTTLEIQDNSSARPTYIQFIDFIRAVACLLVVWCHLGAVWATQHNQDMGILHVVRDYVTQPLAIIEDFGFFGVALFFFVSGFIITHISQYESRSTFLVKRFFRIWPPLWISIVIILLSNQLYLLVNNIPFSQELSLLSKKDIALSLTLWNYFIAPQKIVNLVAWSLVIEEIFYFLCLIVLPLIIKRPRLVFIFFTLTCALVLYTCRSFGDNFFLFAASVAMIPLLLIGQTTYLLWIKKISVITFFFMLIIYYALFMYGLVNIHTAFYPPSNSFGVSIVYAYLIFVILLLLNDKIKMPGLLKFYSKISYSLYLNHNIPGQILLLILVSLVSYPVALLFTLIAVTGLSYLSWRFVEKPSQNFARFLLRLKINNFLKRHKGV